MTATLTPPASAAGIRSVLLESSDPARAESFYRDAFGPDLPVEVRAAGGPSTGFRGFTLSLIVSQPGAVDVLFDAAVAAGATVVKPAKRSLWGYGAVLQAPDGALWKLATSARRDKGPVTTEIDDVVLLLGCEDVAASKRFYVEQGLEVSRSFGSKYVEFAASGGAVKLALYARRALAKTAGVPADGSGSHRIAIASGDRSFTDPDGFVWEG